MYGKTKKSRVTWDLASRFVRLVKMTSKLLSEGVKTNTHASIPGLSNLLAMHSFGRRSQLADISTPQRTTNATACNLLIIPHINNRLLELPRGYSTVEQDIQLAV